MAYRSCEEERDFVTIMSGDVRVQSVAHRCIGRSTRSAIDNRDVVQHDECSRRPDSIAKVGPCLTYIFKFV